MPSKLARLLITSVLILLVSVGCTHQKSNRAEGKKVETVEAESSKETEATLKEDGQVISMESITVPNYNPTLATYRMMYWSEGEETEAYVTAPKDKGSYSLYVSCHGGWIIPKNESHVTEVGGVIFDETVVKSASPNTITLFSMYRGYGKSEGTINGIKGNSIDTDNAIKAVQSYFNIHDDVPDLQDGQINLEGVSMGGGVVLKLAAERKDIKSVIAVSPFVGMDIYIPWLEKHQGDPDWKAYYNEIVSIYGLANSENPKLPLLKEESIDYKTIEAPVLLIQGTDDSNIPWETVQTFYKKMEKNKQKVTFKLVEGGNHALTSDRLILLHTINDWYIKF